MREQRFNFYAVIDANNDEHGFPATLASIHRWFYEKGITISIPTDMVDPIVIHVDLKDKK